jgi:hypothetical protein
VGSVVCFLSESINRIRKAIKIKTNQSGAELCQAQAELGFPAAELIMMVQFHIQS